MTESPSREGHREVEEIIESLVDPVFAIDERGVVLTANPSACSLFGWPRDELVGEKINVLMGEPYRTEHDGYIRNYLESGETKAIGKVRKVIGRHRDGRDFPCELSVSFAKINDGFRFYGIVRDMTEREGMIAKLAQMERLAAMGELAAGVAHEVNNPVNTIINCAQLIKSGEQDSALLDDIVQEGMRIAMIVRDLLDFARDRQHDFTAVEVGRTVERVLNLVARRLERQGITVEREIADDLPAIEGIPHQIQQVVLNLVLNARDALTEKEGAGPEDPPRILVRVDPELRDNQEHVIVRVRDNGIGIAQENLERVFEPFWTRKRMGGTGLGLAVTSGIVSEHGGRIRVESEPGEFAEFEVSLPVRRGE